MEHDERSINKLQFIFYSLEISHYLVNEIIFGKIPSSVFRSFAVSVRVVLNIYIEENHCMF